MKVDIDVGRIVQSRKARASRALGNLGQTVLDDSNFYIPRDQDQLINSGRVDVVADGAQVSWNAPHARYQYSGKVMVGKPPKTVTDKDLVYSKDKNPNAQSHWFEAAKKTKLAEWLRKFQKMMGG